MNKQANAVFWIGLILIMLVFWLSGQSTTFWTGLTGGGPSKKKVPPLGIPNPGVFLNPFTSTAPKKKNVTPPKGNGLVHPSVTATLMSQSGQTPSNSPVNRVLAPLSGSPPISQSLPNLFPTVGGPLGMYGNPLRAIRNLTPMRIDQGVDYGGTGPVYALGPGVIVNTAANGWPGQSFISERLTSGPYAGKYVYAAENIQASVRVGQKVNKNTVIGTLQAGYPFSEFGFGEPPGTGWPLAHSLGQAASGGDPGANQTAIGTAFSNLLHALGAPAGVGHGQIVGTVPKGYGLPKYSPPKSKKAQPVHQSVPWNFWHFSGFRTYQPPRRPAPRRRIVRRTPVTHQRTLIHGH